ncbi:MAG: hypothetical protein ABSA50_08790 [Candidatus Bathyarchaeia archaeon]
MPENKSRSVGRLKFRWVICVLAAVEFSELMAILFYVSVFFPSTIPFDLARAVSEKIVDVDTALLGFTGVIVAVSMQNWKKKFKQALAALVPVIGLLLVSMATCFGAIVRGAPLPNLAFYLPLAFLIMAVTLLFFLLAIIY